MNNHDTLVYTTSSENSSSESDGLPSWWNVPDEKLAAIYQAPSDADPATPSETTDDILDSSPTVDELSMPAHSEDTTFIEPRTGLTDNTEDAVAAEATEVDQRNERVQRAVDILSQAIAKAEGAKSGPETEQEARKTIRQTGRAAAGRTISNNKISRFFDRVGVNSSKQRSKDGLLANKLRARRDERIEAKRSKYAGIRAHLDTLAKPEDDRELKIQAVAELLKAATQAAEAKKQDKNKR